MQLLSWKLAEVDIELAIALFDTSVGVVLSLRTNDQAKRISDKAQEVRDKNKELAHLRNISRVLFDGAILQDPVLNPKKFTAEELACFKWSPVTSCDVALFFNAESVIPWKS